MTDLANCEPTENTMAMDRTRTNPNFLARRILLMFFLSALLGLTMFFVFGFVAHRVALATFENRTDPEMALIMQPSPTLVSFEAEHGTDMARDVHTMYHAYNYATIGLLVGVSLPWLYLFGFAALSKRGNGPTNAG